MRAYIYFYLLQGNLYKISLGSAHLNWYLGILYTQTLETSGKKHRSDDDSSLNLLQFVSDFKHRLSKAREAAGSNLK